MKELLYKKSEAVAALNRVDGFHPMELARKIGEEGQEEQLYLDGMKLGIRLLLTILLSGNSDEDLANSSISTTFPFSLGIYTVF